MDPITLAIIQIVIGIVVGVAKTLAQQAFGQQGAEKAQPPRGYRGKALAGGTVPLSFLVGTIGVPGKKEYRNTWGASGETPNAYLVDVLSFGDLPITDFVGLYVNGEPVTLDTGSLQTQGYSVPEYEEGGVTEHLWWTFKDGTQTTANSYLTGKFGSDPERPWTSGMIGRGLPLLIMTALINDKLFTGFPTYMAVMEGIPLYDPREDTTAGGSGAQRWDDPDTWAFTDNNIVIVYNILRGVRYDDDKIWGGDARAYQLPYANWAVAMDACDEDIDLDGGGTEKRFRAGREIFVNELPADVISELLIGANARICPTAAGQFYVLVGVPDTADGSFTDADMLVTQPTTLRLFPKLDEVVNGAAAAFLSPDQAWELQETPPYLRSDLEDEDAGRRQLRGLTLGTTFSGTQAQRILKAVVEESRRFAVHVVPLAPAFGVYRPLQVLAWTSDANQYTAKLWLIISKTEDPYGNVVLGLQEIDPSDHDWDSNTDERPITFAPMTPIRAPAQDLTGWSAQAGIDLDEDGGERRFYIDVTSPAHQVDVRAARILVYENFLDKDLKFDSDEFPYDVVANDPHFRIRGAWLLPAHEYLVVPKFVAFDGSGRVINWHLPLTVTMPDIRLGPDDFFASFDMLQPEIRAAVARLSQSIDKNRAELHGLTTRFAEAGLVGLENIKTLHDEIAVSRGEDRAAYEQTITVAIGVVDGELMALTQRVAEAEAMLTDANTGTLGLARSLEATNLLVYDGVSGLTATGLILAQVEADVGDIHAGGGWRVEVEASPGGGWSNVGFYAVATDGTVATNASFFLQAKTTGESLAVLTAQQVQFQDALGNLYTAFDAATGAWFNQARIKDLDAGNITAAKIDAGLILQDGTAITTLIAANATTVINSAYDDNVNITDGTPVTGSGAAVTMVTMSLTPVNGTVVILSSGHIGTDAWGNGNAYGIVRLELLRAGSVVATVDVFYDEDGTNLPRNGAWNLAYRDTSPGTSAVTWLIRGYATGAGGSQWAYSFNNSIVGINYKK